MTYSRPCIERRRIVGRLAITQSLCEQNGGIWEDDGKCFFDRPHF